jgi:Icc-related predicted phosphoesterase
MRILALGDIHCRLDTTDLIHKLIGELDHNFDVLLLAGDLTDNGIIGEAENLARQLKPYTSIPGIAILGNHDHELGKAEQITTVLRDAGIIMLDGTTCEVGDVGFVGTKGFCGGFDENLVQPFGEQALKTFIRTSIDEALRLENSLSKLHGCSHKVALMHYAPVKATLIGEPPEIFPFLGTSWLADAVDRRGADVIFHGHAHHGSPFGRTRGNIPVHNVSRFVQMEATGKPYCLYET